MLGLDRSIYYVTVINNRINGNTLIMSQCVDSRSLMFPQLLIKVQKKGHEGSTNTGY